MKLPRFLFEKGSRISLPDSESLIIPEALCHSGDASWQPSSEKGMIAAWANTAGSYRPLPFRIIVQDRSKQYWCWAAVTLAVMQYYNEKKGLPPLLITQAQIVQNRLGRIADVPSEMGKALGAYYKRFLLAPTDLMYLQEEIINGKRPVCLAIEWYAGQAHFVVVYGVDVHHPGSPLLYIMDPRSSHVVKMTYQQLLGSYLSEGAWSETHLTKG